MINIEYCERIALFTLLFFCSTCSKDTISPSKVNTTPLHWSKVFFETDTELQRRFFSDDYIISNNHNLLPGKAIQRSDEPILNMIQYLVDYQDDRENFVPLLVDDVGYPVWSEAELLGSMVLIPLIGEDSDATQGVLIVWEREGVFDFKLILRDQVYNSVLSGIHHPNFEIELFSFVEFDHRLFASEDPILVDYLGFYEDGLAFERCPFHVEWLCLRHWYGPFNFNNPCVNVNGDNNCNLCVPVYYYTDDCYSGPIFGGWGSTNGNNNPPTQDGGSVYNGGGSGSGNDGNSNPLNWWEEFSYRNILIGIIEDLELTEEDVFMTECLNSNSMLLADVYRIMENIDIEDDRNRQAFISAIDGACTCDDYDEHGRELCDERADFRSGLLENLYEVEIESTVLIDGSLYGIDTDGLLHVFVDPIDMATSSEEEILNQVVLVLSKINEYFCEGFNYAPINWRDYFDNPRTQNYQATWNSDCPNVLLNLDFSIEPRYLMEPEPSWSNDNGSGGWYYKWAHFDTNIIALEIVVPYECLEEFDDFVFPDC